HPGAARRGRETRAGHLSRGGHPRARGRRGRRRESPRRAGGSCAQDRPGRGQPRSGLRRNREPNHLRGEGRPRTSRRAGRCGELTPTAARGQIPATSGNVRLQGLDFARPPDRLVINGTRETLFLERAREIGPFRYFKPVPTDLTRCFAFRGAAGGFANERISGATSAGFSTFGEWPAPGIRCVCTPGTSP